MLLVLLLVVVVAAAAVVVAAAAGGGGGGGAVGVLFLLLWVSLFSSSNGRARDAVVWQLKHPKLESMKRHPFYSAQSLRALT